MTILTETLVTDGFNVFAKLNTKELFNYLVNAFPHLNIIRDDFYSEITVKGDNAEIDIKVNKGGMHMPCWHIEAEVSTTRKAYLNDFHFTLTEKTKREFFNNYAEQLVEYIKENELFLTASTDSEYFQYSAAEAYNFSE